MIIKETYDKICINAKGGKGNSITIPLISGVTTCENTLTARSLYEMLNGRKDTLPANCKNCGAPLSSHKCEYCGTEY